MNQLTLKDEIKSMTTLKDEIKSRLEARRKTIKDNASFISLGGGRITLGDMEIPQPMEVVVLDEVRENAYYEDDYDPSDTLPPGCFSLSATLSSGDDAPMVPHESAPNKQSDSCTSCWANQFGSKKKGKACGNRIRLLVSALNGQVAIMKVPPTAMKGYNGYVKSLVRQHGVVPETVLTAVTMEAPFEGAKYHIPVFRLVRDLTEDEFARTNPLTQNELLTQAFKYEDKEEEPEPVKRPRGRPRKV